LPAPSFRKRYCWAVDDIADARPAGSHFFPQPAHTASTGAVLGAPRRFGTRALPGPRCPQLSVAVLPARPASLPHSVSALEAPRPSRPASRPHGFGRDITAYITFDNPTDDAWLDCLFDGCALKVCVHPHLTNDSRQWALRRRQDAIHWIAVQLYRAEITTFAQPENPHDMVPVPEDDE